MAGQPHRTQTRPDGTGGVGFLYVWRQTRIDCSAMVGRSALHSGGDASSNNGPSDEDGGGAIVYRMLRARDGKKRHPSFETYVFPYMDRPNLTAQEHAIGYHASPLARKPGSPRRPALRDPAFWLPGKKSTPDVIGRPRRFRSSLGTRLHPQAPEGC